MIREIRNQKYDKKRSFLSYKAVFIAIILLLALFSVFAIADNNNFVSQVSVSYSFDRPVVERVMVGDTVYDRVFLPGAPCSGNHGEPCLPAKGSYILLPQNTKITDIRVITGEKVSLGSGYNVMPVQQPVPLSQMDSAQFTVPDRNIYNSDQLFPGELFDIVGTYRFRGYEILVLMLHPVQYLPVIGDLFYYKDLAVSVGTMEDEYINGLYRGLEKDRLDVMKKVDNPAVAQIYTEKIRSISLEDNYDLLILTTDEFEQGFEPLKNAHNDDGTNTVIKTLTDIGGGTPENIRDFIRDEYVNNGIEYVLIGGDDNRIPAKDLYVEAYGYEVYDMPSDVYYACLDGTYNYDGDDKWGEPNDGDGGGDVDLVDEVYVGRACVGSTSEVNHFIDKTIDYMDSADDVYLKQVLMVGEWIGFGGIAEYGGNYLDELIDGSINHGYTTAGIPSNEYNVTTLYDRDWPGNDWPKEEIVGHINNGTHIINHLGHGGIQSAMKMGIPDIYSLINDRYCFVYSQTCLAGHFDGVDCFAEYLNVKTDHGAFAVIMNARYGWGITNSTDGPSQRFHREFWDAVFGEYISVISMAHQDSKEDNLWRINEDCMRWCYYGLNLFGDPSIGFPLPPRPVIEIGDITGKIGITTVVRNIGDSDATDVEWTITVTGGILNLINKTVSGTIPVLNVDAEEAISLCLFFGLGSILISVMVSCNEGSSDEETAEGKILIFFTVVS